MRTPIVAGAVAGAALLAFVMGCEADTAPDDRTSTPVSEEGGDAGTDADAAPAVVDPNGGRDVDPASCFAACQSPAFTCQSKSGGTTTVTSAELVYEATGCSGTLTLNRGTPTEQLLAMKIDCGPRTVCLGTAPGEPPTSCSPATFSAFSFGYTPSSGGALNLCMRD